MQNKLTYYRRKHTDQDTSLTDKGQKYRTEDINIINVIFLTSLGKDQ